MGTPASSRTDNPPHRHIDGPSYLADRLTLHERDARQYVPDAAEVHALAREHRKGWLRGYRTVLGFATLVLRRL